MELLLNMDIDVNETDPEGNSALHWSLKACKVPDPEHIRYIDIVPLGYSATTIMLLNAYTCNDF